ncbi:MAG TPA: hypothetical protein VM266_15645 [Solirubrobacteraceae bacterium]|nr:hypothetical protein [Solirubrobacteraceae bacterium]
MTQGRTWAAVAAVVAALAAAGPAAAQVQLPAKPQTESLDSEAPPGAPPHWLPGEKWVMQHWLPYDETRLHRLLGIDRGKVWQWLRDDTRNLAGLARSRGWQPEALARALVAPWQHRLRRPQRLALLERRALRTLTQGHLAQHVFFHSLHQNAVPDNAPAIFGVATREHFQALRRSELSPVQICRLYGRSAAHAERAARATLEATAAEGVRRQSMPPAQARRLLGRQLRQLPRWLGQTRYNGPPPLEDPRASAATASNYSNNAALSADGKRVVWESYEARVPDAKTRGEINVLGRPLARADMFLVSVGASAGPPLPRSSYNPAVSADGRFVAFESAEGNLNFAKRYGQMAVFVRDVERGRTVIASPPGAVGGLPRSAYDPAISADGRIVAYESSESGSGRVDVWTTDLRTRRSARLRPSLRGIGRPADPQLSGDGRYVVFSATAPGADAALVYRHDLRTGRTRAVSSGAADAYEPVVSADGGVVAFTALVPGQRTSRVMAADLRRGALRVVAPRPGQPLHADAAASEPALSADGRSIAFVARDARGSQKSVWAADVGSGAVELVSRASGAGGPPAAGSSEHPAISADGRRVAFTSDAWNLSDSKCNAARGIFVRDRRRATTRLLSSGDGTNRYVGATRGSSAPGDMTVALVCA